MSSSKGQIQRLARTSMAAALFATISSTGLNARNAHTPTSDVSARTAPPSAATPRLLAKSATKAKASHDKPVTKTSRSGKKQKTTPIGEKTANLGDNDKDFETYLDRLMKAESNGRLNAKNPRSSALGPYQFIQSTFLYVARRYLADQVKGLDDRKILALRTDMKFARSAAAAYSRENAAYLAALGLKTTYGNLRLAFLLGPSGAADVLKAKPKTRVPAILPPAVIRANPFLVRMSAADLIARSNREISIDPSHRLSTVGLPKVRARPRIRVKCNLSRPSCRRWLALKRTRLKISAKKKTTKKKVARRNRR